MRTSPAGVCAQTADDSPVLPLEASDAMLHEDATSEPLDVVPARLPHLPGAQTRIAELVISVLIAVRALFSGAADRMARASDSPWMRWAAHSARISVHGMPQTFSV